MHEGCMLWYIYDCTLTPSVNKSAKLTLQKSNRQYRTEADHQLSPVVLSYMSGPSGNINAKPLKGKKSPQGDTTEPRLSHPRWRLSLTAGLADGVSSELRPASCT